MTDQNTPTYKQQQIARDGQPPIRFVGQCIGCGQSDRGSDDTRGTDISIYETKGGKYVAEVDRWTRWQGESGSSKAQPFGNFPDLIDWLREDSHDGQTLGRVSQEAVEDAIKTRPELAQHWVEVID